MRNLDVKIAQPLLLNEVANVAIMGKRKREHSTEPDERQSVKQQRVQHKLKLGVTKIRHAFKISKGFERQKLGRRQKKAAAENNDKDVKRIDSEIAALKALDTTASAQQHLYKSLLKIKDVSDHPDLPSEVKKPVKLAADAATLNVNARLCKANQVKEAVDFSVSDVQKALGLNVEQSKPSKKRRLRAADLILNGAKPPNDANAGDLHLKSSPNAQNGQEGDDSDNESTSDLSRPRDDGASHSSEDGEGEDDDVAALERQLASEGIKEKASDSRSNRYSLQADLSVSEADSEARSASPEPRKAPAPKKSSFIPSLTLAGYVSGSGSDVENDLDDLDVAPRKNRRGQRARQQIWEKKFGSKAKHLQKSSHKQGWDPKRGAVDENERRGNQPRHRGERRASPDYGVGGDGGRSRVKAAPAEKKYHKDDTGPIHPSWIAAKKAKEKKDAPVAFQGRKITFD